MQGYLAVSEIINWQHREVISEARRLSEGLASDEAIARTCFLFVRDEIKHSLDYQLDPLPAVPQKC